MYFAHLGGMEITKIEFERVYTESIVNYVIVKRARISILQRLLYGFAFRFFFLVTGWGHGVRTGNA